MKKASTSVLIVGGGLAGLSAATFLAWRGVPSILIEKHASSSPHPRAIGFMTRTMEIYHAIGLGAKIPQVPLGMGRPRRLKVESLAGKWATEEIAWTPEQQTPTKGEKPQVHTEFSICTGAALAQDRLEPILREKAVELGADVRMSTSLVSFKQDDAGVTAVLQPRNGQEYALTAQYMIGADGASSPVREALGIGRDGRGELRTVRSVLFRASLDQYRESGINQFEIEQPGLSGMLTTYGDGRWLLMFSDDEERDDAALQAMVVKAIGRSDLPIEIITTGRWELTALIADKFSLGRVFLAGDAAHTLPPARGGYGANTGIEDAHNIAWKIAAVVSGPSTPALLDTYDAERRPVAWLRHGQIFARPDYHKFARTADREVPIIDDAAMELGQLYRSSAVIGVGEYLPPARRPDQWAGQPGTRAPHIWVSRKGAKVSTLDLVQPDWVLLTEDERWTTAVQAAVERLKIKLECKAVASAGKADPAVSGSPLDTPLAVIVANAAGKSILETILPQLVGHKDYESVKSMSLREFQPVSQGQITESDLATIESALAGLRFVDTKLEPDDPEAFQKAFGIGPAGASLIRPDGYVAWRSLEMPGDPTAVLIDALERAAFARPLKP